MRDAFGEEIAIGDAVVYGAPVGRSIALAKGVVDGFTESGRVWVRITARSYGGEWYTVPRVHVGPDRLMVLRAVDTLDSK